MAQSAFGRPSGKAVGDDGGCFEAALEAVRTWGGVLEHPEASKAWAWFGLNRPPRSGGWVVADDRGGWTCRVEQGHFGHRTRKGTWLYAAHCELPSLPWGPSCPEGYESRSRGEEYTRLSKLQRAATPVPFRDLLVSMAETVHPWL